jgi:hypothetical protein
MEHCLEKSRERKNGAIIEVMDLFNISQMHVWDYHSPLELLMHNNSKIS